MPRKAKKIEVIKNNPVAFIVWTTGICIVLVVGAILLGRSDSGQININSAIQNSNQQRLNSGEENVSQTETIPEAFRNRPNGGLVPQGRTANPEPVTPTEEESTDAEDTEEDTAEESSEEIDTE